MGSVQERGINPPPPTSDMDLALTRWLNSIYQNFPLMNVFEVTWNPDAVAANTSAEQTVTVTGLNTNDVVWVNKPTATAGIGIVGARVSAKDTLAITFMNATGGSIDPGEETYRIGTLRK